MIPILSAQVIFWLSAGCIALALIVLSLIELRLRKKLNVKKQEVDLFYHKQVQSLQRSGASTKELLILLDELSRSFFQEAFSISRQITYTDRIDVIRSKGKEREALFCEQMQEKLYGGEHLSRTQFDEILAAFADIVDSYELVSSGTALLQEELKDQSPQKIVTPKIALWTKQSERLPVSPQQEGEDEQVKKDKKLKKALGVKKVKYPDKEPAHYKYIRSTDNLDRIKKKIQSRISALEK